MVAPLRGSLYWGSLDPTVGSEIAKTRPCVVVSDDVLNQRRRTVVVIPISSSAKPQPVLAIPVVCQGTQGVAVIDQIRAVAKERLGATLGRLNSSEMSAISEAIRIALDLS